MRRSLRVLVFLGCLLGLVASRPLFWQGASRAQEVPIPAAQEPPAPDTTLHTLFTEANTLYDQAKTEEDLLQAASNYRQLIEKGIRNEHIYYNLGNTYLRLGDVGRAILSFRRALLYDPAHPYASASLDYARALVPDKFPGSSEENLLKTLFFWHFNTSFHERLSVLTAVLLLFWALLAFRLFRRLPFHNVVLGLSFLVSLSLGISLAADEVTGRGKDAVIVAEEVEVRSGNGAEYTLVFERPIRSGVEVRILDTRGHWHQVEFPGGTVGWVIASAVEPVQAPAAS